MSLNQAFLKIFDENGTSPKTAEKEFVSFERETTPQCSAHSLQGNEMNISYRIDQGGENFLGKNISTAERRIGQTEGIFSFEEEKRRRNPIPEPELREEYEEDEKSYSDCVRCPERNSLQAETAVKNRVGRSFPEEPSVPEGSPKNRSARNLSGLISSAGLKEMRRWPVPFQKILERGATEFAELADAVEETADQGNKIFGFGGWGTRTGVSTLVTGLLHELVQRHRRVLLVDANFEHPEMVQLFGVRAETGWEDLLWYAEGSSESGLVRVNAPEFPFYFLPLVPETASEAAAAGSKKKWLQTFLELTESFDIVLIDHGSFRTENDREKIFEVLRFGSDGYFMVTDKRSPLNTEISEFSAASRGSSLPCFGVIENFT